MGIFKKASSTVAQVAATEEAAAPSVETEITPEPEGLAEVIALLEAAANRLAERIGDAEADDLGHPQWRAVWTLARAVSKMDAVHPSDALKPTIATLWRLLGQCSPLPPGESLPTLINRLALERRGEPSESAKRLLRSLDLPARSQYLQEADTLRDAQRMAEAWRSEREAEALERVDAEADARRAEAKAKRERAAQLRGVSGA